MPIPKALTSEGKLAALRMRNSLHTWRSVSEKVWRDWERVRIERTSPG